MEKSDFIAWVKKLQDGYQMSAETHDQISKVDLVAVVGPTGVGKSAIMQKLDAPTVIIDMTRPLRGSEKQGVDINSRTDYLGIVKDIKEGKYVQFVVSGSGEFYGTTANSYTDEGLCSMPIIARVIPFFRQLGFKSVRAFYVMPPSYKEWMRRLAIDGRTDLLPRIDEARESLEMAANNPDDFTFILNDDIDAAVDDIRKILDGEELDAHRQNLAQQTANILLEYIGDGDSLIA